MKTKAEHSIIADAIHEWHTVYLPCIRNLSHNALKSYGEGMKVCRNTRCAFFFSLTIKIGSFF